MQEVTDAMKEYCESKVREPDKTFSLLDLHTIVSRSFAVDMSAIVNGLNDLITRGEVQLQVVDADAGRYQLVPRSGLSPASQQTMFEAPSNGTTTNSATKKKKTRFTKKGKKEALEALQALGDLPPALERLHDWLFEQVYE